MDVKKLLESMIANYKDLTLYLKDCVITGGSEDVNKVELIKFVLNQVEYILELLDKLTDVDENVALYVKDCKRDRNLYVRYLMIKNMYFGDKFRNVNGNVNGNRNIT